MMITVEDAESVGRKLIAEGYTTDELLATWRQQGLSVLHSIQCLSHITGMSLGEAKEAVHTSRAWRDMRTEHDRIHDQLEKMSEKQ